MPVLKLQSPFEKIIHNSKSADAGLRSNVILQAVIDASNTHFSPLNIKITNQALYWLFNYESSFKYFCKELDLPAIQMRYSAFEAITRHYCKYNLSKQLLQLRIQNCVNYVNK